jgi:hypothetical protein
MSARVALAILALGHVGRPPPLPAAGIVGTPAKDRAPAGSARRVERQANETIAGLARQWCSLRARPTR